MSKTKVNNSEIAISRVMIMFFACSVLSFLSWLYIIPFKKHYLQINEYYNIIEYVVIAVTFLLFVASLVYSKMSKNRDFSSSVITPGMLKVLSLSTFVSAVVIPFSNNRTIVFKYVIMAFITVFVAYLTFYFVSKQYAFHSIVCGMYFIIFQILAKFYSDSITFYDTLSMNYSTAVLLVACLAILIVLISYLVSKKKKGFAFLPSAVFSVITLICVIVRIFIIEYVSVIASAVLILALITMIILEKIKK